MSDWRSPIPNKLPIVPKKEGAPAGEKAGDGRENGEGKVQGAVKVRKEKNTVPQTGPYSGGFFQLTGVRRRIFVPANGPVFRGIPLRRHLPSDERGSPVFLRKNDRVLPSENVPRRKGEQEASHWPGEGRALKDIWHSCGKRCVSRGGHTRRMQSVSFFRSPMIPWRPKAKPGGDKECAKFPGSRGSELGSGQVARPEIVPASVSASFQPGNTRKGQNQADGAAGDRKTKIGGTRDRRSNFAVFQIPFVPGIDKIGGKGAFFLADPIGERGDVVF